MSEEKDSKFGLVRDVVVVVVVIIVIIYVWNTFFVSVTAWDALDGKPGQPGTMEMLEGENGVAVLTPVEGFHMYTVSQNLFGWHVKDDYLFEKRIDETISIQRETLKLKNKKKMHVVVALSEDQDVGYVNARDETGEIYGFNGTANDGTYLYYMYREEPFPEKLIFEAYSHDRELLYEIEE